MKANQNFRRDDEAVSPVIGVILMVAITVVLAAVVFVLVNNLGEGAESAPTMTFTRSESADRLTVVTAPSPSLDWDQFTIRAQGAGGVLCVNVNANADSNAAGDACDPANDADAGTDLGAVAITAGSYLHFCSGELLGDSDVTITISHDASGSLVGSFTFASIGKCATRA